MSVDHLMAKYFRYATHAQVLKDHPDYAWEAVADLSPEARAAAKSQWKVPIAVRTVEELAEIYQPDIAVIATPPALRTEVIRAFPSLQAVLVEKPLGLSLPQSQEFVNECAQRGIAVQVNFWRRGDELFRRLSQGELEVLIGRPLAVFGLYGNGLMNNGSHLIDFIRLLLGEVAQARVIAPDTSFLEGPLPGDRNVHFHLQLESGLGSAIQAIPFRSYREVGLDIWGEKARLSILQESLGIYLYPRKKNRAIADEWEIASDQAEVLEPTCGQALYHLYDNIARALTHGEPLWSPGESALKTERFVHQILAG